MKKPVTYQKMRGGYYTPKPIATFLSSWAIRSAGDRVLEPSCGDGVFVETAAERLVGLGAEAVDLASQIMAYEIDEAEASLASERLGRFTKKAIRAVKVGDFFATAVSWNGGGDFEAVVGNPPFVRYQQFPEDQREKAFQLMRTFGLHPNRLTNAWVPFVVAAASLLSPTGRFAMVLPAELMQVSYAAELRSFLTDYFDQVRVITFRGLPFPGIQQEIILLLALRGKSAKSGIEVLELDNANDLFKHTSMDFGANGLKAINHTTDKWIQYYLTQKEIDLLRSLREDPRLTRFGDIADTDVGIVTGMNEVFALSGDEVCQYGLMDFAHRLVSRSGYLTGMVFRKSDWGETVKSGNKAFLLDIPPVELKDLPSSMVAYLKKVERDGLNLGYKCRTRKYWYTVPSIYIPDAFMLRQIHRFPKLVVNIAGAASTDTIHRVRFKKPINRRLVASAFLNSLTFAFSEIIGRSYGGGVLELEPTEADALPIPLLNAESLVPSEIDRLVRSSSIEEVLNITDRKLLADGLGLSTHKIQMLRTIWIKLQSRRIGRKNGNR
ncbi:MAG: class I SAM-dependent methyltransferase [Terracidiphilus sp.]